MLIVSTITYNTHDAIVRSIYKLWDKTSILQFVASKSVFIKTRTATTYKTNVCLYYYRLTERLPFPSGKDRNTVLYSFHP